MKTVFLLLNIFVNWFIIYIFCSLFTTAQHPALWATLIAITIGVLSVSPIGQWFVIYFVYACRPPTKKEQAIIKEAWIPVAAAIKEKSFSRFYKPRFFMSRYPGPNAFAIGARTICITQDLLQTSTEKELAGVIAHEMGHLQNKDTAWRIPLVALKKVADFTTRITIYLIVIKVVFLEVILSHHRFSIPDLIFLIMITALALGLVSWLCHTTLRMFQAMVYAGMLAVGRKEELTADAYAEALGFAPGLISYLSKIREPGNSTCLEFAGESALAPLYRTHPSTTERIERITTTS